MNGFNVGYLKILGVCDWTLEISNDDAFAKRMKEINAELRFKHKITDPQWETRKVGGGKPVTPPRSPKAKPKAADRKILGELREQREIEQQAAELTEAILKPEGPRRPNRPAAPTAQPVVREGSIAGEVDLAAARRLARS
jgi:hypothetical protein